MLAGCAALPRVTQATLVEAQRADPGIDLATLESDRALYARRCGACHQAHLPAEYPAAQWPTEIADMAKRAQLQPGERERILRWILAARATPEP